MVTANIDVLAPDPILDIFDVVTANIDVLAPDPILDSFAEVEAAADEGRFCWVAVFESPLASLFP